MAKKRQEYIGWGFVKDIIREYGNKSQNNNRLKPFQTQAIKDAVDFTKQLANGSERLKMVDLVFWKQTHTLAGAAMACHVSYETAINWHGDFIKLVGKNLDIF